MLRSTFCAGPERRPPAEEIPRFQPGEDVNHLLSIFTLGMLPLTLYCPPAQRRVSPQDHAGIVLWRPRRCGSLHAAARAYLGAGALRRLTISGPPSRRSGENALAFEPQHQGRGGGVEIDRHNRA